MTYGMRQLVILSAVILVITIFPLYQLPSALGDLSNPSALISHNPININGDSQFTVANGVVSGGGTKNNPYIIENWSIDATNDHGIYIRNTYKYFIIQNCFIYNGTNGNPSRNGIYLDNVDNGVVKNNRLMYNYNGIYLTDANTCIISYNNCSSNQDGIHLFYSKVDIIKNNTCKSNTANGIFLRYFTTNNTILNNTIISNMGAGINIYSNVENNFIYNNYFRNGENDNHKVMSGWENKNTWNIKKTIGRNIIGGPYLGGNYWSNYSGVDIDGDGLGDTYVPYNDGDNHPLTSWIDLVLPKIIDKTSGTPTTGDPFVFNATVLDFGVIKNVNVEYWFDDGKHLNVTMNKTRGDNINGDYAKNITVPDYAFKLYYFISASDIKGNCNCTILKVLDVIDNDPPLIVDHTMSIPTTGDNFTIESSVTDNIKVANVFLEFWFDDNTHQNLTLASKVTFYNKSLLVPSDAKILSYFLSAVDTSNNWAKPKLKILNVIDNDKPIIKDLSGTPTTGDEYTFSFEITDNIEVSIAYQEYWVDKEPHKNVTLPKDQNYHITLPIDAFELHSIVTALDTSNNLGQLKITRPVIDNDPPIIDDLTSGNPETGRTFIIRCFIFENRMIENVTIEYWFDERDSTLTSFTSKESVYYLEIEAPIDAITMQYIITAEDASNNIAQQNNSLPVIDIIPPTIIDLTEGVPTTGEQFIIKGYAEDNIGVESLYLEYWFDFNDHLNISFNESRIVYVPGNARELYYIFHAVDVNDNTALHKKNINVIDNDKPKIKDFSKKDVENYRFSVKVTDNIKVYEVTVNYWYKSGNISTITLSLKNGLYEYSLSIPDGTEHLYYTIYADDTSSNWERTKEIKINFTLLPLEPEQPTQPETEPSSAGKTSERIELWLLLIIIIIIIIILIALGVYSYFKKKKRSKQESQLAEALTIKPGAISTPVISIGSGPATSAPRLTSVASTTSTTSAQPPQASTISMPKLTSSVATSPTQTTQQIPQVPQLPLLPPVQKNEMKPEISKTTPEPGTSSLIPQVVQQAQNPQLNEPPTLTPQIPGTTLEQHQAPQKIDNEKTI